MQIVDFNDVDVPSAMYEMPWFTSRDMTHDSWDDYWGESYLMKIKRLKPYKHL